ncbi:phage major capsid protein [Elstera cyanobacteriorum]|uniref:phage major capsid protein n=1 Tax=Elstera cyanobacteriorum TaxID=2022747 RepID=UPI002354480C|nr:phage major capsid protein [Elstera cyanobacteriorum]MCK6444565.1 phage major capsid protein [Elstera cyanobacteriorum]
MLQKQAPAAFAALAVEGRVEGYGTVFEVPDLEGDIITPGAFAASLDRHRQAGTAPRLLWQHDPTQPIGRWVEVREDARGLRLTGQLALETQAGREAYALLKQGALDGLSLGFLIRRAESAGPGQRRILEADLLECSPVTFPCHPEARVLTVKTLPSHKEQIMTEQTETALASLTADLATLKQRTDALDTAVRRAAVQPQGGDAPAHGIGRLLRALAGGRGDPARAADFAAKTWNDGYTAKALAAGVGSAGGYLVPEVQALEVVELLRKASAVRRLGPTVVPMPHGTLLMAKLTGGAQADYLGENTAINPSLPSFGQIRLTARKLAALVPISNDLIRYSAPAADQVVRDDLVTALAEREDLAFLYGNPTGTGNDPKGIRHWVLPAQEIASSGATVDAMVADLAKLVLALQEGKARMLRPAWIMAPRTLQALMAVRDGSGHFVFRPELQNGTLNGYPVATSLHVPVAPSSEILLVDMADVLIGEATGLLIDASGEAAYPSGGSVIPAFGLDQTVIRCVTAHDLALRHEAAVAVLTGVTWTP